MNQPPSILRPAGDSGVEHPLFLTGEFATAVVVATDPEQQPLRFVWTTDGPVTLEQAVTFPDGDLYVSSQRLVRDPALDGTLLTCTVVDQAPEVAFQEVLFRVEVP